MHRLTRTLVPIVALATGTWVGLGQPDPRTAIAAAAIGRVHLPLAVRPAPAPSAVPPLEREPPTVDPTALADPAPPFPDLNPDERADRAWLLSEGPLHSPGDGRRLVTFTFDDGPFPETAPTVLRILAEHDIRATFFLIGGYLSGESRRAAQSRYWAKQIAAAGHFIGNHTLDHKVLTRLSHAAALAEIDDSAVAIERATGTRPWLFRPPYGSLDPWLEGALRDRRLELLLWNVDVQDIERSDPDAIARSVEEQLEYKQGGIVLLHDMHWPSVRALHRLVRWLEERKWDPAHPRRRGWDVVDLPEYLRQTGASPQPYATREELEHARRISALGERGPEL